MNTTNTAPDPGYYVPTTADCLEAGMINTESGIYQWVDHVLEIDGKDISVYLKKSHAVDFDFRPDGGPEGPYLMDGDGNIVRKIVFGDYDKCMAFLRNHMVTAADQGGLN